MKKLFFTFCIISALLFTDIFASNKKDNQIVITFVSGEREFAIRKLHEINVFLKLTVYKDDNKNKKHIHFDEVMKKYLNTQNVSMHESKKYMLTDRDNTQYATHKNPKLFLDNDTCTQIYLLKNAFVDKNEQ